MHRRMNGDTMKVMDRVSVKSFVVYSVGDDWAALYVDGSLDYVGDSYLVVERVFERLGVEQRSSEVMEAVRTRDEVPATLEELEAREAEVCSARVTAAALREEAQRLLDQASSLERQV